MREGTAGPRRLLVMALVGFIIIVLYALQFSAATFVSVLSVGTLAAGASLLVGSLLGFLFGIPRTLQSERPRVGDSKEQQRGDETWYQANTNLEQISDWLTKILVGLGLTQISGISASARSTVHGLAQGLGNTQSSGPMAAAILLFYLTCGFLLGYLWTRLNVAVAFRQADIETRLTEIEEKTENVTRELQEQAERDARALGLIERILRPDTGAPMPSQQELDQVVKEASIPVKIQVFLRAYETRRTNWRNNKPIMERTIPLFQALASDDSEDRFHRNHGQLGYALKDKDKPAYADAEAELTKAIEIRDRGEDRGWYPLYEFNRAICRIARYPADTQDRDLRQAILDDLGAAWAVTPIRGIFSDSPEVMAWMEKEGIKESDLQR